jgi:hypothetical protein
MTKAVTLLVYAILIAIAAIASILLLKQFDIAFGDILDSIASVPGKIGGSIGSGIKGLFSWFPSSSSTTTASGE